jgi:ERCC4-type nuclease
MIIKIDVREHELIKLCKYYLEISPSYKDISIEVEALPLGDVIITDGSNERVIIERKSLRDLTASIKDGRYEEQSYRLNGINHHNHNIIYLIEGDMNRPNVFKDKMDKSTLYSAMFSLNYYKGFSVLRSIAIDETAMIICNMAYKIKKSDADNKQAYYLNRPIVAPVNKIVEVCDSIVSDNIPILDTDKETDNYCSVVKKVKKENITPDNIGEILLSQIPSISSVSAKAVMMQFKTFPNLILKINENEACLKNITYINEKNQSRKISKLVISNIIKYLKS